MFVLPSRFLHNCCWPDLSSWAAWRQVSRFRETTQATECCYTVPVSNEDPTPSPRVYPTTSSGPLVSCKPIPAVQVLERIPRAARHQCHLKLTTILEATVRETTVDAWNQLFHFPTRCLQMPARLRGRTSVSLASRVKKQSVWRRAHL